MRSWRLPERSEPFHVWTDLEVVLSFNGPQILFVGREDDGLYLSVASDEGPRSTRWLRSRISRLEKSALMVGAITVRACILKPEIWVVDTNLSGDVIMEWCVGPDALTEADLPSTDSFLPEEILAEHLSIVRQPSVTLDSADIIDHAIGFRVLADLLQQLQRLWNAIGQSILGGSTAKGPVPQHIVQRTELMLDGLVPGSVGLQLRPADAVLFREIAEQYGRLVRASDDPTQLRLVLRELKARVHATYADYISAVQRHNVEVFTRWDRRSTFLSAAIAARVEPVLGAVEDTQQERVEVRGYFNGFNLREADFEFVDPESQERYQGRVSARVLRSSVRVVIGPSFDYLVELSIVTTQGIGGSPRHLIGLESIRSGPVEPAANHDPADDGRSA